MTELAIRQPDAIVQRSGGVFERDIIDGWVQVMSDVAKLADYISETDFVPKGLRNKPAAIAACILTGRELGIGPMQSLKSIYMVQGIPSLSAEYKRARALAAGHEISIDETNSTRCIIRGRRAGSERWVTITWTLDMAKRAKLSGKDIWQAYPQRMLQARASGELCDLLFPDASLGLATTEVLEDGGIVALESGEMVDAATGELTTGTAAAIEPAKPKTAQRRTRTPPPPAAPKADPPADSGLPPLPGEDEPTPPPAEPVPGDAPGDPVSKKRLTAIWTAFTTDFGASSDDAGKDEVRAACGLIANRGADLASSKELTNADASTVLDTLAHLRAQAAERDVSPRELLMALLTEREEGQASGE